MLPPFPMRKIVQIAVIPGDLAHNNPFMWALCDDGSLWMAACDREDGIAKWEMEMTPDPYLSFDPMACYEPPESRLRNDRQS